MVNKLFDTHVSFSDLVDELKRLNFKVPSETHLGYLDGEMIISYMKHVFKCNTEKVIISNEQELENLVNKLNLMGGNADNIANALIHDGYIVFIDKIIGEFIYIIDPHVYETTISMPNLNIVGKGGEGWKNISDVIFQNQNELGLNKNEFLNINSPAIIIVERS